MANVGPRGINWVPGVSAFPELNVRTYVVHEGKPGVWFFSLDAASMLAVRSGADRVSPALPPRRHALRGARGWIDYHSDRAGEQPGRFVGRYRPIGEVYRGEPGTLEHWLTERYCLYALDRRGRIRRGEIHHEPWPLQAAQLELETCTVSEAWGIHPVGEPETLHFVRSLDVVGWLLE